MPSIPWTELRPLVTSYEYEEGEDHISVVSAVWVETLAGPRRYVPIPGTEMMVEAE